MDKTETEKYFRVMMEEYGIDISAYDQSYLEKAIQTRMHATFCPTHKIYYSHLSNVPAESSHLLLELGNSYSEFFRNSLSFSFLEQSVLPKIINDAGKSKSGEIRIWSAGCASGQEPYSLAILLDHLKNTIPTNSGYLIFATDNSEKELELARKGIFDFRSVKNTRLELAEKYFLRKGDSFSIDNIIKNQVDFSHYDLLDNDSSSPPSSIYGDFDLIMCCNVLFYYEPEYQQMILNKMYRSLKKGGFFITGEAEAHLINSRGGFRQYATPAAIFVKN